MLSSGLFSHGYLRFTAGRSRRELTEVRATTVDQMVQEFGVPTHIKVDVEGHELAVIRGARTAFTRLAPVLFLELHNDMVRSDGQDPSSVLDEVGSFGYRTFGADGTLVEREAILAQPIIRIIAKH